MADTDGNITAEYTYEPFGKSTSTRLLDGNRYQFVAGHKDGSGLFFDGSRYYSPTQGRYVSEDPFALARGTTNSFVFASNDPVNTFALTGSDPPDDAPGSELSPRVKGAIVRGAKAGAKAIGGAIAGTKIKRTPIQPPGKVLVEVMPKHAPVVGGAAAAAAQLVKDTLTGGYSAGEIWARAAIAGAVGAVNVAITAAIVAAVLGPGPAWGAAVVVGVVAYAVLTWIWASIIGFLCGGHADVPGG